MDSMTATEFLLKTYPSMAKDKELIPLMERMMIIEKQLKINISKTKDPSTTHEQLVKLNADQNVLLAQADQINSQINFLGNMRHSLAKLERGRNLLNIRQAGK
jgi:hypothetical protein